MLQSYRAELRKFQNEFGSKITPTFSVAINNQIERALEKDPEGSQVIHVLNDWREILTPMVS